MIEKIQIKIKRLTYRIRRDYLTLNNVVVVVAIMIAISWAWGSIEVMQQNYALQQSVDTKRQQVAIEKLRVTNLELESKYFDSSEYQELAVRERLGYGMPGEKLLIVASTDKPIAIESSKPPAKEVSNFQQWQNLLLGSHQKTLQD